METKQCIYCRNANNIDNNFCTKCGKPLHNICTYVQCYNNKNSIVLSDEDAFCPLCGNETIFKKYGLVSSYDDEMLEELPF